MSLKTLILLTVLATSAAGHGLVTSPRSRRGYGACSYCLNAGGPASVGRAGGWTPYEPMKGNKRGGFGICGDHAGKNGHMKAGQGARRSSKPIGSYSPGSVANFEFKITANHRGYLEFYLCDVENNPGQDIQFSTFPKDCHYLERVPHSSCESGKDQDCGPIDSRFPGRWMLPCGKGDFGGENGKMAYRLPNKRINVGVVHVYWLSANSCLAPDGFTTSYKYPSSWPCKMGNPPTCGQYSLPEEFWNCADVTVTGSQGKTAPSPKPIPVAVTTAAPVTTTKMPETTTTTPATTTTTPETTTIPSTTATTLETTTMTPETTTTTPETTTTVLKATTAIPESTTSAPKDTTTTPKSTTDAPETTIAPEATKTPTTTGEVAETRKQEVTLNTKECKALLNTPWPNGGVKHRMQCWNHIHCAYYESISASAPEFCRIVAKAINLASR